MTTIVVKNLVNGSFTVGSFNFEKGESKTIDTLKLTQPLIDEIIKGTRLYSATSLASLGSPVASDITTLTNSVGGTAASRTGNAGSRTATIAAVSDVATAANAINFLVGEIGRIKTVVDGLVARQLQAYPAI